jgi:hypothetical protein
VDTLTWIHGSWSHSFSVTVVFYSDELIRSPDDDPKGSKLVVTIKTYVKHTPLLLISFQKFVHIRNTQQDAKHRDNNRGIFTEPLPSNNMGIFTDLLPSNERRDTQTHTAT